MASRGFCSPFDEALAHSPAGALFLVDREDLWRFDPEWTRDAWGRGAARPGPWRYVLARDLATGFVQRVLVTASGLLEGHPRLQLRSFATEGEAERAFAALGTPPLAEAAW